MSSADQLCEALGIDSLALSIGTSYLVKPDGRYNGKLDAVYAVRLIEALAMVCAKDVWSDEAAAIHLSIINDKSLQE